jgi:hypothetical protein
MSAAKAKLNRVSRSDRYPTQNVLPMPELLRRSRHELVIPDVTLQPAMF